MYVVLTAADRSCGCLWAAAQHVASVWVFQQQQECCQMVICAHTQPNDLRLCCLLCNFAAAAAVDTAVAVVLHQQSSSQGCTPSW